MLSAVPPKADIDLRDAHVRFVPEADLRTPCAQGPMTPLRHVVYMHYMGE